MIMLFLGALPLIAVGCAGVKPETANTSPATSNSSPATSPEIDHLWEQRSQDVSKDFPIGPGDILQISVPDMDAFTGREFRVAGTGEIALPLLGSIEVAGLTESELAGQLRARLSKYMLHPEVEIFVKSFSTHSVAVMGAVRSPGILTLNGPHDTLRNVIERAGGLAENAGSEVVLTPASSNDPRQGQQLQGSDDQNAGRNDLGNGRDDQLSSGDQNKPAGAEKLPADDLALPPVPNGQIVDGQGRSDSAASQLAMTGTRVETNAASLQPVANQSMGPASITIKIDPLRRDHFLDFPVRPGDTIFVPPGGSVVVNGWVHTPKILPLVGSMTVLQAVSNSGGAKFAADTSSVKVTRTEAGQSHTFEVDLNSAGSTGRDTALRDGDVVEVPYSAVRVPPYVLYSALASVVLYGPLTLLSGAAS